MAEKTKLLIIVELFHEYWVPPPSNANTSNIAPVRDSIIPGQSTRAHKDMELGFSPLWLGKKKITAAIRINPPGTLSVDDKPFRYSTISNRPSRTYLNQKTHRHVVFEVMAPPITGPRTLAQRPNPLTTPDATPRCLDGTTSGIEDKPSENSPEPPMPCRALKTILHLVG
jgi:hypothetical protein